MWPLFVGEEGRGGRVGVYERESVFVKEGEKQVSCVNEKACLCVRVRLHASYVYMFISILIVFALRDQCIAIYL